MLNTIKIPTMLLMLFLLVFLPKISYAWDDQHGRDEGRAHHEHGFHAHANPDLTLITGMDNIDSRVLIASDPDQTPGEIDQPAPEIAVSLPTQVISAGGDDSVTVNVPNKAGGYTAVLLTKWGDGYLGPQGELYYPFPEVSQLKAIYGI